MTTTIEAKEVVLAFIQALNEENFDEARRWATDDLTFVGVLGTRLGADAYFQDMERMKLKYSIQKIFVNEEDICLWYEIDMSGIKVLSCGWYHVVSSRIDSFKVLFDPRPVLEASNKKKS